MYYDTNKATMMNECTSSTSRFNGHDGAPVQYKAHHPMQHGQGYSGSHWMLASSNYLLRIAPAATRATGKQTTINKYTYKAGHFDGYGNAPVHNRVHCLMEEVQIFTRSHWMPPLGKYYCQNHRKRSWVNAKNPVFYRGMPYQTKEKGIIKVSI
jgi:hypothetical protein